MPNQPSSNAWEYCLVTKLYLPRLLPLALACVAVAGTLLGCGGGSSANAPANLVIPQASSLPNLCAQPNGANEKQGSVEDEKAWVRSFVDERYLWYKDVPVLDPKLYKSAEQYFEYLKTQAKNKAGGDLDRFHWSETKEAYEQYTNGIAIDYGIDWSQIVKDPPRNVIIYNVEPNSPAGTARVRRGDKLIKVDGIDVVNAPDVTPIYNGTFPQDNSPHTFELQRGTTTLSVTLKAGLYDRTPVREAKVFTDNGRRVAYLYFDSFVAKSQDALIAEFKSFSDQNATELVLDIRYNSGGLLYISSQLAYMIAGQTTSSGKIFYKLVYNDKRTRENYTYGFIPDPLNASYKSDTSRRLPSLNLSRVTLLVDHGTASASEAVINGLRGIGVTVNLIGATTYGKPYGFTPQSNCGRYYYAVEFKGENHQGFSDYDAGFAPTCTVKDDLNFQLGDVTEPRLAEALQYLQSGKCTSTPVASIRAMGVPEQVPYVIDPKRSRGLMTPDIK